MLATNANILWLFKYDTNRDGEGVFFDGCVCYFQSIWVWILTLPIAVMWPWAS